MESMPPCLRLYEDIGALTGVSIGNTQTSMYGASTLGLQIALGSMSAPAAIYVAKSPNEWVCFK